MRCALYTSCFTLHSGRWCTAELSALVHGYTMRVRGLRGCVRGQRAWLRLPSCTPTSLPVCLSAGAPVCVYASCVRDSRLLACMHSCVRACMPVCVHLNLCACVKSARALAHRVEVRDASFQQRLALLKGKCEAISHPSKANGYTPSPHCAYMATQKI